MKYRPSNGTEGEAFQARWCHNCIHDQFDAESGMGGCEIIMRSMLHDVNDPEYPEEWQQEPGQAPRCTAFHDRSDEPPKPKCPNTTDMFERCGQ